MDEMHVGTDERDEPQPEPDEVSPEELARMAGEGCPHDD